MTELNNLNLGKGKYFGPDDELPFSVKNECITSARKELEETNGFDLKLNLEKDDADIREHGQEIGLISFIGPYDSLKAKHETLMFNIRGSCDTIDETRQRLTDIQKITKKYDIYTFEMYTWISIPPNPDFMKDNDKHELYLNKIINGHKLRLQVDKEMFEARKRLMVENMDNNEPVNDERVNNEPVIVNDERVNNESVIVNDDERVETINKLNVNEFATNNCVEETQFNGKEKLDQCRSEDQNWAVISIVGNDLLGRALKIKGFYETEEEARTKTAMLTEIDNTFENYIVECYRWLKADIQPNEIEDQVYDNEELNTMNNEHKIQKNKALQHLKKNPPKQESSPSELLSDMEKLRVEESIEQDSDK